MNSRGPRRSGGCLARSSSFALRKGACGDRFVALVDPTAQQPERDLLAFAETRDDPTGLVHSVAHLLHELLRAREEERTRQLHADRHIRALAAEEDEDLLPDLR